MSSWSILPFIPSIFPSCSKVKGCSRGGPNRKPAGATADVRRRLVSLLGLIQIAPHGGHVVLKHDDLLPGVDGPRHIQSVPDEERSEGHPEAVGDGREAVSGFDDVDPLALCGQVFLKQSFKLGAKTLGATPRDRDLVTSPRQVVAPISGLRSLMVLKSVRAA